MAQIRRTMRDKDSTQQKVIDILRRADLLTSVIAYEKLAKPARLADEPIIDKFTAFLASETVSLPKDKSRTVELLKAMKESVYYLLEKKGGLSKLNIALMNEHRRSKRQLPPLTAVDYNCMDRASLKLKMVLDTLSIQRRISGLSLAPRNLAQLRRLSDY